MRAVPESDRVHAAENDTAPLRPSRCTTTQRPGSGRHVLEWPMRSFHFCLSAAAIFGSFVDLLDHLIALGGKPRRG